MSAYYNEFDPFAAAWLRNLIAAGHIAPGDVDTRSILDVKAADLKGYTQCHFFAGIGGWSLALRLAGWPDSRPVWTGSCPCQPFSCAGKGEGKKDARHLWPRFRHLICDGAPAVVFGEQVESKAGRIWLAGVRADLEILGYAVGAADLCAASRGAPHRRQRIFWVAHSSETERSGRTDQGRGSRFSLHASIRSCDGNSALDNAASPRRDNARQRTEALRESGERVPCERRDVGSLADTDGRQPGDGRIQRSGQHGLQPESRGVGVLVQSVQPGLEGLAGHGDDGHQSGRLDSQSSRPVSAAGDLGFWSAFDLIPCADGKARRIEPGTFPLAHGVPNRVGRLRGYGNAIVPQAAAEFIIAYCEAVAVAVK